MKCPRCQAGIESKPDPAGFMVCPGCGARLRRTSAQTAQAVPVSVQAGAMTLPPSDNPLGPRRVSTKTVPPEAKATAPRRVGDDTARVAKAAAAAAVAAPFTAPSANAPATAAAVDSILVEVRAVRRMQEEILEMLRGRAESGSGPGFASGDDFEGMHE